MQKALLGYVSSSALSDDDSVRSNLGSNSIDLLNLNDSNFRHSSNHHSPRRVKLSASSTQLSNHSSLSSCLLLRPEEVARLFEPDEEEEEENKSLLLLAKVKSRRRTQGYSLKCSKMASFSGNTQQKSTTENDNSASPINYSTELSKTREKHKFQTLPHSNLKKSLNNYESDSSSDNSAGEKMKNFTKKSIQKHKNNKKINGECVLDRNTKAGDHNVSTVKQNTEETNLKSKVVRVASGQINLKQPQTRLSKSSVAVRQEDLDRYRENKEITLENMGFYNEEISWDLIDVPEKKDLLQSIHHRLTTFINPDITLIIDNHEFFCHRIVLQSYSQFFEDIPDLVQQHIIHVNSKVTAKAFFAVYSWMLSSGQTGIYFIKKNNIIEVLIAAETLRIKDLEEQCLSFIANEKIFSEANAFFLLKDACFWKKYQIKDKMVPRIRRFFLPLVSSENFIQLNLEDLCSILQSNYIVVHCELEVFMSAVRWIISDWEERSKYLPSVMRCIRFGLMTPAQLVDIRKNPESPEIIEITRDKNVQLLIEDGLAYAVEFSLTGKSQEHYSRCDLLKLSIPEPRNFTINSKEYRSYQNFLDYLSDIKRNPHSLDFIEWQPHSSSSDSESNGESVDADQKYRFSNYKNKYSKSKSMSTENKIKSILKFSTFNSVSFGASDQSLPPDAISTVESKQNEHGKQNIDTFLKNGYSQNFNHENQPKRIGNPKRNSLKDKAATIIQATYRGYQARKILPDIIEERGIKFYDETAKDSNLKLKSKTYDFNRKKQNLDKYESITRAKRGKHVLPNAATSCANDSDCTVVPPGYYPDSLYFPNNQSVLVFGGLNPSKKLDNTHTCCAVYRYVTEINQWEIVSYMPKPRYYHSAAKLNGKIFIVGGCNPQINEGSTESLCAETLSFDPLSRKWNEEPSLLTPRKSFGLGKLNNFLYVIGGQDKDEKILSSVERFDPTKNIWEEVKPFPEQCLGAATCGYKGMVWVVGGINSFSKLQTSNQVYCYDPARNEWLKKPPLRFGRAFASLTSYKGVLYLVGGATSENNVISSIDSIDVWDENSGTWKLKVNMAVPRHGQTVAFLGNQMLVIGGTTTKYVRTMNQVDAWCTTSGIWGKHIAPLPSAIIGHCSVKLPPAKTN